MSTRESLLHAVRTIKENWEVITGGVATAGAIGTAASEVGSWKQHMDDQVELEKVQVKRERVQVNKERVQVEKERLNLKKNDKQISNLNSLSEVATKRTREC